ncbi:MAG: cytochrome c [Acidimicrobiales bacterium]|nr:cytochrome c [Acidimicrobiales bacterium]
MAHGYPTDPVDEDLERSTNKVMAVGAVLLVAMALAFPVYLQFEPGARADSRADNVTSLANEGESIWSFNCSSCHGQDGGGVTAPALNSKQFLQEATDAQARQLVAVGVPGTQMSAFSQDFGGPLTSEQIRAVITYVRSWEDDAPDDPEWRTRPLAAGSTSATTTTTPEG